jgi:O-antigen/teichoic acid export membrane protein
MLNKNRFLQLLENNRVILTNAISLIGTLVVTSGLGFAFWWLVARRFEPAEAGLASAAVSAMFLLGTFGMMGMGTLLIGELSIHPEKRASLISTALLIVAVSSAVLGWLFSVIAGHYSEEFAILSSSGGNILLFVAGVSLTGITLVLDQALLGLLRANWQLWRNAVVSTSKLALLIPMSLYFDTKNAMVIYASWQLGNILSLLFVAFLVGRKQIEWTHFQPQWRVFWEMRGVAAAHHVLNLSLQASQFAMPVIVTLVLTPEANASFYVAWLIVTSFFVIPSALTQTLYAVSAADVSILAQKIRFTLRMSFLGVISGGVVILLLAEAILGFFNDTYALTATSSLRVLILAAVPVVVRVHYVAIHQIRRQIKQAALTFVFVAALELTFSVIGGLWMGLLGLSIGWVLAMYIEAGCMVATVYRTATEIKDAEPLAKTLSEGS